jgi:hypothetical protein
MHRLRGLVVVGALAVVVSAVVAGPAVAAKGGNNDTAKACQHGGWQTLLRSDGSSFASPGECASYGAHGGTFDTRTKSQVDCESVGGTFSTSTPLWTCTNAPRSSFTTLTDDCFADLNRLGIVGGSVVSFDETLMCESGATA